MTQQLLNGAQDDYRGKSPPASQHQRLILFDRCPTGKRFFKESNAFFKLAERACTVGTTILQMVRYPLDIPLHVRDGIDAFLLPVGSQQTMVQTHERLQHYIHTFARHAFATVEDLSEAIDTLREMGSQKDKELG